MPPAVFLTRPPPPCDGLPAPVWLPGNPGRPGLSSPLLVSLFSSLRAAYSRQSRYLTQTLAAPVRLQPHSPFPP